MRIRSRPATPATVFLAAAFILLLLSCLSVPVTKTIALGAFDGASFGVFGYCVNGICSPPRLGYPADPGTIGPSPSQATKQSKAARSNNNSHNFSLPDSARNVLSDILVVHVVAATLTLVILVLCVIAHVRSPSHSPRFLFAICTLSMLSALLTLLSFVVDLLMFLPHFAAGTWLVLAATISNIIATILLCCGRRTLIDRKAMRRRIAENAEMSGRDYKDQAVSSHKSDQRKVPQYAEFVVSNPVSPDRLPFKPSQPQLVTGERQALDQSAEKDDTQPGVYKVGLPYGAGSYGGGYVRMPQPYGAVPPVRQMDRKYPPQPPGGGLPTTPARSNVGVNVANQPPPSRGYPDPAPPLPPVLATNDNRESSVYSDYVPPRQAWAATVTPLPSRDEYPPQPRYRPERPKIDTYNLEPTNRMVDPLVPARQTQDVDPPQPVDQSPVRRTPDSGNLIASYYEDVDPRFDDPPLEEDVNMYTQPLNPRRPSRRSDVGIDDPLPVAPLRRNHSTNSLDNNRRDDDEYRTGPRSPAASTSSHFTSVSQRGINPRWQPTPPHDRRDEYGRPRRKALRNDQMQFLSGNPDFELPLPRSGRKGPPMIPDPGGRYPVPR